MVRGPVALEEDILLNLLFSFICLFLLSGDIQGEEKGPIGGSFVDNLGDFHDVSLC